MNSPRWFTDLVRHDPRPLEDPPPDAGQSDSHPSPRRRTDRSGLTPRDTAVVSSLAALRCLTTRQIERLHFQDAPTSAPAAARAARRCLAGLRTRGLVTRLRRRIGGLERGSAVFIWRLTAAGASVADLDINAWRSHEPGPAHVAHTLDVAEVVVRLHERARNRPVDIAAVETEPHCWRHCQTRHSQRAWLKPDLRLTLRVPGHELHWFVEIDRGTEYRPALRRKIASYLAAWRDGAEQARAGVFPRVAWVVPKARVTLLQDLCASTPHSPAGLWVVVARTDAIDALTEPPR